MSRVSLFIEPLGALSTEQTTLLLELGKGTTSQGRGFTWGLTAFTTLLREGRLSNPESLGDSKAFKSLKEKQNQQA